MASERSGDGRGVTTMSWVPAASSDRAMAISTVLRPDLAGPAVMNTGTPAARSGPAAVSSSPPTPTMAHSGLADARRSRSRHASSNVIRAGSMSTRNGRADDGSASSRCAAFPAMSRITAACR